MADDRGALRMDAGGPQPYKSTPCSCDSCCLFIGPQLRRMRLAITITSSTACVPHYGWHSVNVFTSVSHIRTFSFPFSLRLPSDNETYCGNEDKQAQLIHKAVGQIHSSEGRYQKQSCIKKAPNAHFMIAESQDASKKCLHVFNSHISINSLTLLHVILWCLNNFCCVQILLTLAHA